MIDGRLIGHNDPDYQERVVKFNELIANAAIYSTALDITDAANALAANALAAEGHPVDTDDLATGSLLDGLQLGRELGQQRGPYLRPVCVLNGRRGVLQRH